MTLDSIGRRRHDPGPTSVGCWEPDDSWRVRAACLGQVELMMDSTRINEALLLCLRCPVVQPCREFALNDVELRRLHRENKVWYSVIGGLTPSELHRYHRAGRVVKRRSA